MNVTVKKRTVKNEYHIFINVHDGGKYPKARPATGVKINKNHWNKNGNTLKKNWVSTKDKDHKTKNQQIYKKLVEVEAEMNGITTAQTHTKKNDDVKGGRKSFVNYAKERMELRRNLNSKDTDIYSIKKFEKYLEEIDSVGLQLKEINKKFVRLYYNWLLKTCKKTSTANTYMNIFQAVYRAAVEDDTLNFNNNVDVFKGLKREPDHTSNRSLSESEFYKFKNVEIPDNKPRWKESHDMFMYQFWGAFRVMDVMYTKWGHFYIKENKLILDFVTTKGKGERVMRVVPVQVVELLLPYIKRYYPDLDDVIRPVEKDIRLVGKEIKKIEEVPMVNSVDDVLKLLKGGYTYDDIEYMRNHQMTPEETEKMTIGELRKDIPDRTTLILRHNKMRKYIELEIIKRFKSIIENHPDEYVFHTPNKENLQHPKNWNETDKKRYKVMSVVHRRYLREISKHAGVKSNMHSHVSRHTATQFLLDDGASTHATSEYLGHSSLITTEKYRSRLGNNNNTLTNNLSKFL